MEIDTGSQKMAAILFDQERESAFGYDKISSNIVHYCSCEAANSITSSKPVYFNVSSAMNDISEVRWAFQFINDEFNKVKSENSIGYSIVKSALEFLDVNFNIILEACFLFCMSELHDNDGSLSMWRAYGADGNGCAIKFDSAALSSEPQSQFPISINRVHYLDEKELSEKTAALISSLIISINSGAKIKCTDNFRTMISSKIFDLCASIKHPAFKEEREMRLIYRYNYDLNPGRFQFKSASIRGLLRPIIEVKMMKYDEFPDTDLAAEKIISGIIVGPSQHAHLNELSLRMTCINAGIAPIPDQFFHRSTIPYRAPR